MGIARTDWEANIIWSAIDSTSPYPSLRPGSGDSFILIGDTVFVQNFRPLYGDYEMRFYAFSLDDGSLLYKEHVVVDFERFANSGLLEHGDNLLLYGYLEQNEDWYLYFFELNRQFELLGETLVPVASPIVQVDMNKKPNGGFILAYADSSPFSNSKLQFLHLDEMLNVVYSTQVDVPNTASASSVRVRPTSNGSYILQWMADVFIPPFTYYSNPPAIARLDSLGQMQWQYTFATDVQKNAFRIVVTESDDVLGVGNETYYSYPDSLPNIEIAHRNGWCFLIDGQNGALLWERSITDVRDAFGTALRSATETPFGYTFAGMIDRLSGPVFPLESDVWLLTLDTNGCWNGNCNNSIHITGDTTSISPPPTNTTQLPPTAKTPEWTLFPNPVSDVLTVDYPAAQPSHSYTLLITDITGRELTRTVWMPLQKEISLPTLPAGMYLASLFEEGVLIGTQKLVKQ